MFVDAILVQPVEAIDVLEPSVVITEPFLKVSIKILAPLVWLLAFNALSTVIEELMITF